MINEQGEKPILPQSEKKPETQAETENADNTENAEVVPQEASLTPEQSLVWLSEYLKIFWNRQMIAPFVLQPDGSNVSEFKEYLSEMYRLTREHVFVKSYYNSRPEEVDKRIALKETDSENRQEKIAYFNKNAQRVDSLFTAVHDRDEVFAGIHQQAKESHFPPTNADLDILRRSFLHDTGKLLNPLAILHTLRTDLEGLGEEPDPAAFQKLLHEPKYGDWQQKIQTAIEQLPILLESFDLVEGKINSIPMNARSFLAYFSSMCASEKELTLNFQSVIDLQDEHVTVDGKEVPLLSLYDSYLNVPGIIRVVVNLFSNAKKIYDGVPEADKKMRIHAFFNQKDEPYLELVFEDFGSGFPSDSGETFAEVEDILYREYIPEEDKHEWPNKNLPSEGIGLFGLKKLLGAVGEEDGEDGQPGRKIEFYTLNRVNKETGKKEGVTQIVRIPLIDLQKAKRSNMDNQSRREIGGGQEKGSHTEAVMTFGPGHSAEFVQNVFGKTLDEFAHMDAEQQRELSKYFTYHEENKQLGFENASITLTTEQAKNLIAEAPEAWQFLFEYSYEEMSSFTGIGEVINQYAQAKKMLNSPDERDRNIAMEILEELTQDISQLGTQINTINRNIMFLASFTEQLKALKDTPQFSSFIVELGNLSSILKDLEKSLKSQDQQVDTGDLSITLLNIHSFLQAIAA